MDHEEDSDYADDDKVEVEEGDESSDKQVRVVVKSKETFSPLPVLISTANDFN